MSKRSSKCKGHHEVKAYLTRTNNNSWEARACKPEKDFSNIRTAASDAARGLARSDQKPLNSSPGILVMTFGDQS